MSNEAREAAIDDAELYVPGEFKCAKCGFTLSQFTLNANSGAVGSRDHPGEKCPNDGSPLWRVTWKQRAHEHYERAREEMARADAAIAAYEASKPAGEVVAWQLPKHCGLCIDCDGTGLYPSGARCKSCLGTGLVEKDDGAAIAAFEAAKPAGEVVAWRSPVNPYGQRGFEYAETEQALIDKGYHKRQPLYAALAASPVPSEWNAAQATHRHVKHGTEYVLIGFGKMQAEEWFGPTRGVFNGPRPSVDMAEVAIYRSVDDGSLWVRPREEFEDGRFVALTRPEPGVKL